MNEQEKVVKKIILQSLERKLGIARQKYEPIIDDLSKAIATDLNISQLNSSPRLNNSKSASAIQELLLQSMHKEWGKTAENYDPLVEKMAGALATELEHVYFELDTQTEHLMLRLGKELIPDHRMSPIPAYGVAKANLTGDYLTITKENTFIPARVDLSSQGEETPLFFSPLSTSNLFNGDVKYLVTNKYCYQASRDCRFNNISSNNSESNQVVTNFLIGIESPGTMPAVQEMTLFFNLSPENNNHENRLLLRSIEKGTASVNGRPVSIERGIIGQKSLGGSTRNSTIENNYLLRTKNNFLSIGFNESESLESQPDKSIESLKDFIECHTVLDWETAGDCSVIKELVGNSEKNIIWLKFNLSRPLMINNFGNRFYAATNHFPIINRKIEGPVKKYFDGLSPSIFQMQLEEQFLNVENVINENSGKELEQQAFSSFSFDNKSSYSIRRNGVGRIDNYNSWNRFKYLFNVYKREYRYEEVVELVGKDLLLSELARLINDKQISEGDTLGSHDNIYIIVVPEKFPVNITLNYWICQGEKANGFQSDLVAERPIPGLEDVSLIMKMEGGRDSMDSLRGIFELKATLSHARNLMTTAYQLKTHCEEFFQDNKISVEIKKGIENQMYGAPTRTLEVFVKPKSDFEGIEENALGSLEEELNHFSVSTLPIKVFLKPATT